MPILTDLLLNKKPTGKDTWLTESGPKGNGRFVARITLSGERMFYFRYTSSAGNRVNLPIGPYDREGAKGLTLKDARARAGEYSRLLQSDQFQADRTSVDDILRLSPKMAWLIESLRQIRQRQEKVIVFCEFRDLQRTLQRCIAHTMDVHPDIINGDTSASAASADSRQKRIKVFQAKPGFGVIVLSPLAVGFGVNTQAANHVVHFTRTWNPAKEDQATDRAYRIGQEREVFVYYPVIVADDFVTFDQKLDQLLEWKRGLSSDMLNGTGELSVSDFLDIEAGDAPRSN